MSDLPFDLLFVIFSELSRWELLQCMLVCRAWNLASSVKYFEEVHLIGNKNNDKRLLHLSEITCVDGSRLGDYVKRLYLDVLYGNYDYLDEDTFQRLLFNLPQLQKISIRGEYVKHIMNIPQFKLIQIRNITLYNYCERQGIIRMHFTINRTPKNQIITSPRLISLLPPTILDSDCRDAIYRLYDFKVLNKLTIEIIENNSDKEKVNLSNVLNVCSDLESLEIRTNYNWNIEDRIRHTTLESLKLDIMELTEEHIEYIVDYIPNLKHLELKLHESTLEYALNELKPATIDKFATYLRRIKNVQFASAYYIWTLNRLHLTETIQLEAFWRFARVLCEDECYCNLNVNVCIARNYSFEPSILKKDKTVYLSCNILLDSFYLNHLVDKLRDLTFESIKISNPNWVCIFNETRRRLDMEQDGYPYLIELLLRQLSRQKHKKACSIDISNLDQELCFKYYKEIGSKKRFDGTIVKMRLTNDLLERLSQVYPDIRLIHLNNCTFEKVDPNTNIYDLDLSYFESIQELVLDVEKVFTRRKASRPLYIQFIDALAPNTYDYYYYDEKKSKPLYHLGKQKELSVPKTIYLVKIYHKGIMEFKFRRSNCLYIPETITAVNSNE